MNRTLGVAVVSFGFIFFMLCTTSLIAQEMEAEMNGSLSLKQQKVLAIAAFTANGDTKSLIRVLNEGLDSGLTVNEIGEVLLQMYAYAGFPRSLNGLSALSSVLEERQTEGTRDPFGTEPDSLPEDTDKYAMGVSNLGVLMGFPLNQQKSDANGYNEAMDAFLKEHLFADIFGRNNLSFDMRELATVGALSSLKGTNSQLLFHMSAAMNCGISEGQMHHAVDVIKKELGNERGNNAEGVLVQVLERRQGMAGN
jgi:4-carboxymuconolactone decarboxylase